MLTYFLIYFLTYLHTYLSISTSFRIGPFHFQAVGCRRHSNLTLIYVIMLILCCSIFCYGCMFAFVVLDLVFQYEARRLAGKNVS